MTNTAGSQRPHQPEADVVKPTMTELLRQTGPRGFGNHSSDQRYQEIFEDEADTAPGWGGRAGSMGQQPPFSGTYGNQPYEDTVLFFHHCKRGIRLSVQANTRTFIVLFLVFIALTNSPGLGELVNNLMKSILNVR
jgi:hypothetical protein